MVDLISRAAAIEAFDDERVDRYYGDVSPESVIRVIESIPAVDAERVVRCKDCRYAHMTYDGLCKYCDMRTDQDGNCDDLYLSGNYYCADAERRDDNG